MRTVEVDEPVGSGVRLSVVSAGICGTDVTFVAAGISGFVYGHEFAGVDDDGRSWFVEASLYGGRCDQCRRGDVQRCTEQERGNLGVFIDGGMAERVVVPEYTLLALPDGLDVRDACLIEPGAVAWHALRRARVQPGERLLVLGGGTIGLLAAAAAQHRGHSAHAAWNGLVTATETGVSAAANFVATLPGRIAGFLAARCPVSSSGPPRPPGPGS